MSFLKQKKNFLYAIVAHAGILSLIYTAVYVYRYVSELSDPDQNLFSVSQDSGAILTIFTSGIFCFLSCNTFLFPYALSIITFALIFAVVAFINRKDFLTRHQRAGFLVAAIIFVLFGGTKIFNTLTLSREVQENRNFREEFLKEYGITGYEFEDAEERLRNEAQEKFITAQYINARDFAIVIANQDGAPLEKLRVFSENVRGQLGYFSPRGTYYMTIGRGPEKVHFTANEEEVLDVRKKFPPELCKWSNNEKYLACRYLIRDTTYLRVADVVSKDWAEVYEKPVTEEDDMRQREGFAFSDDSLSLYFDYDNTMYSVNVHDAFRDPALVIQDKDLNVVFGGENCRVEFFENSAVYCYGKASELGISIPQSENPIVRAYDGYLVSLINDSGGKHIRRVINEAPLPEIEEAQIFGAHRAVIRQKSTGSFLLIDLTSGRFESSSIGGFGFASDMAPSLPGVILKFHGSEEGNIPVTLRE